MPAAISNPMVEPPPTSSTEASDAPIVESHGGGLQVTDHSTGGFNKDPLSIQRELFARDALARTRFAPAFDPGAFLTFAAFLTARALLAAGALLATAEARFGFAEPPVLFDMAARFVVAEPAFFTPPAFFTDDALLDLDDDPAFERLLLFRAFLAAFGRFEPAAGANVCRTPSTALAPTFTTAPATPVTTPPIVERIPPSEASSFPAPPRHADPSARGIELTALFFTRLFVLTRFIPKLLHECLSRRPLSRITIHPILR